MPPRQGSSQAGEASGGGPGLHVEATSEELSFGSEAATLTLRSGAPPPVASALACQFHQMQVRYSMNAT